MTGLQTGLIDAFQAPPLLALGSQWFGGAKNMLDIRFAQLVGATLIDKPVWDKIPAHSRNEMLKICADRRRGTARGDPQSRSSFHSLDAAVRAERGACRCQSRAASGALCPRAFIRTCAAAKYPPISSTR